VDLAGDDQLLDDEGPTDPVRALSYRHLFLIPFPCRRFVEHDVAGHYHPPGDWIVEPVGF
jgi:hypothetical protein